VTKIEIDTTRLRSSFDYAKVRQRFGAGGGLREWSRDSVVAIAAF
jgi:hypothetical protein